MKSYSVFIQILHGFEFQLNVMRWKCVSFVCSVCNRDHCFCSFCFISALQCHYVRWELYVSNVCSQFEGVQTERKRESYNTCRCGYLLFSTLYNIACGQQKNLGRVLLITLQSSVTSALSNAYRCHTLQCHYADSEIQSTVIMKRVILDIWWSWKSCVLCDFGCG